MSASKNKANKWGYFLCMLVFYESMMNKLLITLFPIENILGYVMIIAVLFTVLTNKMLISKYFLLLYFCIFVSLVLSIIFLGGNSSIEYIIWMISFTLCGVICAFLELDYTKVFKMGTLLTAIFVTISICEGFADAKLSSFSFGYALIPGVLTTFFTFYNEVKQYKHCAGFFLLFLLGIELVCIIKYCSRSNLLQIYIFLILCLIFLFRKKILGILGLASIVFAVIFTKPLIFFLYELTQKLGIHISAIWKFYWLLTTSNQTLLHGREELFAHVTENLTFVSLFFGHGVGAYEKLYGTYTHNIFLQALYEFGIPGCVLVFVLYYAIAKRLFNKSNLMIETEIYIFLITLPFIKLLLSSVYWRESLFWFSIVLITKKARNTNIIIKGMR